jgi:multidrug efflux pump subunit AcrA (membrane-fusion protein)
MSVVSEPILTGTKPTLGRVPAGADPGLQAAAVSNQLLAAVDAANRSADLTAAARVYADLLSRLLAARLVAMGLRRAGRTCRLVAIAGQDRIVRGAPLVSAMEGVLTERLAARGADSPEPGGSSERTTDAERLLRELLPANAYRCLRLHDGDGHLRGACLLVYDQPLTDEGEKLLERAVELIGPHLVRLRRNGHPWWQRCGRAYRQLARAARRACIGLVVAGAVLLFALPLPFQIRGRCEVQPVTRRFVAAPYEGRLQDVFVAPGDVVRAGQVLAEMDGREIRLELSGLESDLQRVTKQRDQALANRETAAAQIALLEMQRLQSSMQLYRDRLENLEIRSPTDGVVIAGDPQKLKGARLTIGQTLLEVGPLGEMVLEVAIADRDVSCIQQTTNVRFRLDALPQTTLHGQLIRVCPRSEIRDGANVFIGQVQIDEQHAGLMPGMRGRAKLAAGRRSLFWLLFHRALEQLGLHLGW